MYTKTAILWIKKQVFYLQFLVCNFFHTAGNKA